MVSHKLAVLLSGECLPATRQLEVNDSCARSLWKVVRVITEAQSSSDEPEPSYIKYSAAKWVYKTDLGLQQKNTYTF